MNWQLILTVSVGIVTVIGSVLAARYTGRSSVQVKEVEVEAAAYQRAEAINVALFERLESEVKKLSTRDKEREEQVKGLRRDLDSVTRTFRISMNFIERFLLWAKSGSNPPIPPVPESLREHLDPALLEEHARQSSKHPPSDAGKKA